MKSRSELATIHQTSFSSFWKLFEVCRWVQLEYPLGEGKGRGTGVMAVDEPFLGHFGHFKIVAKVSTCSAFYISQKHEAEIKQSRKVLTNQRQTGLKSNL